MCVFYASRSKCEIVQLVEAHAEKGKQWEAKKPGDSDAFSEVEHKH